MQKSLLIFIGGTGLRSAHELRKLIAERYTNGLQDEAVASLRFLWIDTDDGDLKQFNWTVLGKDISLKEGEKVIITGDRLGGIIESRENYPEIDSWLPEIKNYIGDPGPGAKGIRPYGRLIYTFQENRERIGDQCRTACNSLNGAFPALNEWRIYVIAGTSGGTGSGMFLPLLWDLQHWNIYEPGSRSRKLYGFLVLPSLTTVGRHNRYLSNAYALVRELNYYSLEVRTKLPLDNCYLLEPKNAEGLEVTLESLPLLIAQRIFLNIQDGAAASTTASIMDNPSLGNVSAEEDDPETRRRHSRRFSTFGLATVSYPREIVACSLAGYFAQHVVSSWIQERDYPSDIVDLVNGELANIRLSFAHICGDSDPFGIDDHKSFEGELSDLVDQFLQNVSMRKLSSTITKARKTIVETFRERGIKNFYKRRRENLNGAIDQSIKQLRMKITDSLRDPNRGLPYTKKFLEVLLDILRKYKAKVSDMAGDDTYRKSQIFQDNLSETINLISNREQSLFYLPGTFRENLANASDELKQDLKFQAKIEVGKYGMEFLEGIIPEIQNLRDEIDRWESRVRDTKDGLTSKLETMIVGKTFESSERGVSIFDRKALNDLLSDINLNLAQSEIENSITRKINQGNLDLINLMQRNDVSTLVYNAAYDWVLSDRCTISPQFLTLYDKFIDAYPNSDQRQKILTDARKLSSSFLRYSKVEIARSNSMDEEYSVVTIPNNLGRTIQEAQTAQVIIKNDLESIGVPSDRIFESSDTERIVFLQERQAFPLRFIESLRKCQESYEADKARSVLHIDKDLEAHLYELYLLTKEEKSKLLESQEVFIFARIQGWLSYELNQRLRVNQVRYEIQDSDQIGVEKLVLGSDWEISMKEFTRDALLTKENNIDIRRARIDLINRVKKQKEKISRDHCLLDDLRHQFSKYLDTLKSELDSGEDDEIYTRDRTIINRILKSFK